MIKVATDSVANLPADVVQAFGIAVIPTYVSFGAETLRDGVDIGPAEFYRRLVASPQLPVTTQPSVDDFEQFYRRLLAQHPGATIISIHLSHLFSGILASAQQAAARLSGADIRVFDSYSVSLGQGLMVREAAAMAEAGADADAILRRLEAMRAGMQFYAVMDTLDYMAKGGRIGRAARLLGTLLDMKPIITIKNGAVDAYSRERSRARALEALRNLPLEAARGKSGLHLAVMHAACEEEARALAEDLRTALKPKVFLLGEMGPALGVYTGPGAIAVAWWAPA